MPSFIGKPLLGSVDRWSLDEKAHVDMVDFQSLGSFHSLVHRWPKDTPLELSRGQSLRHKYGENSEER